MNGAAFAALGTVARHGRYWLVGGLVAGLLLPDLAVWMRPSLPAFVALMVFVAAFRIGPRDAWGGMRAIGDVLGTVLATQLLLPLLALALFAAFGLSSAPIALAATMMLAAPSISGSPNLTILLGHDPAPALRLVIVGTALFPLTVVPILALSPLLADTEVASAAARLVATIAGAAAVAFLLRQALCPEISAPAREAIDGASALLMSIVVIALMAGLAPALRDALGEALFWIAFAFGLNFTLQAAGFLLFRRTATAVPRAVVAGNRNVALFFVALPPALTDPVLSFIGAYQLPMYLTPVLMGWLYRQAR